MPNYYVNTQAQANGDHEVHQSSCEHQPALAHRHFLGAFDTCVEAVRAAKKIYPTADGCYWCSNACHKR